MGGRRRVAQKRSRALIRNCIKWREGELVKKGYGGAQNNLHRSDKKSGIVGQTINVRQRSLEDKQDVRREEAEASRFTGRPTNFQPVLSRTGKAWLKPIKKSPSLLNRPESQTV